MPGKQLSGDVASDLSADYAVAGQSKVGVDAAAFEKTESVYRADVDGLRAVAVLSVFFYHLGAAVTPGGFIGVDVFFVISGFVITTRVERDVRRERFSILDFYERRIRRILPALAVVLFATFAAFAWIMPWENLQDLARSLIAAAFSFSNVFFWKSAGYFDPAAELRPLLHTWSLAVEEQFYIVFPVFFILLARQKKVAVLFPLLAIALLSFLLSVAMTRVSPSGNFYLLPTRAWELLVGSALALSPRWRFRFFWARQILGAAGALMIAIPVSVYDNTTPFPGLAASLPVVGAALVIATGAKGDTFVATLLSKSPFVSIGAISYSLYLVHWPVITLFRYWLLLDPGFWAGVAITAVSIALAWLSWRYVERPFRRPARPWPRAALFLGAAATLVAIAGVGVLALRLSAFHSAPNDGALEKDYIKYDVCFLVNAPPSAWGFDRCQRTHGAGSNALLWGDSFAAHYMAGILDNSNKLKSNIVQYTSAGCPPILNFNSFALPRCHEFNEGVFDVIKRMNITTVILSARWDLYRNRLDALGPTLERLKSLGLEIYVIGASPVFTFDPHYLAARNAGLAPNGDASWTPKSDLSLNLRLRKIAKDVSFVDAMSDWCQDDQCAYMRKGTLMFSDYGHFSKMGSIFAVDHYFPLLKLSEADHK